MKTFDQFNEDASAKFKAMSDEQFADWKKSNPGGAAKADSLRGSSSNSTQANAANKGGQLVRQKQQRQSQMGKWAQSTQKTPPQGKPATPQGNSPQSKKPGPRLGDVAKRVGSAARSGATFTKNKITRAAQIAKAELQKSVGEGPGVSYGADLRGAS